MTTFKAAPAWTRPEYVGSGSCTVPEGVDPESLAPDGAVMRYSGSPGYIAWRTPETWVRVVTDHQSILDWMPPSATALTPPRAKGDVFDHRWVCIIDWPGLEAWRAQQAQAAPKPADMGPAPSSPSAVLHGIDWAARREPDDTLPPQDKRARHCDGHGSGKATTGPDIIPAAVLARRATGYHRGRVSMPTDLDDGLIPDAEPEGIVPRGAR